ncbi:MAG TPA: hypothetical protein VMW35_10575 [Myxococcota bacterium]|jgi:hypothetical protein|nr:hypothetical protein [Myxococcota bacterium]
MSRRAAIGIAVGCLALGVVACASGSGSKETAATSETQKHETKPPQGVPPPPSSKLSKVAIGMSDEQVRELIGPPDTANGYITGKSFIPFYYGPDTARTDWKYKGQGRVVFSRNQWSGQLKVIRIDYDPNEQAAQ